ncbi:hypothetical protein [Undibacter mobilis]|nr:hypothetical protein [Undibacter mobilis]
MSRYEELQDRFDAPDRGADVFWTLVIIGFALLLGALAVTSNGKTDCLNVANDQARLACFDAAASPQPAKGAVIQYK